VLRSSTRGKDPVEYAGGVMDSRGGGESVY
jgi:hypothetical protein